MQSLVRMYLCDCQEADSVTRLHSERFGSLFCLAILQVSELCPELLQIPWWSFACCGLMVSGVLH
jgi:hypothetical protein